MPEHPPIALFVYARPEHLQHCLNALASNDGSSRHPLIIFADAAKGESDLEKVQQVRELIQQFNWPGLKQIRLREQNVGLYANVISGLDEVFSQYRSAIIMEDDLVSSPCFLHYCKVGLLDYQSDKRVWSINAYQFDLGIIEGEPFLSRLATSSWGWATWADRWQAFRKNYDEKSILTQKGLLRRINFGGYPFSDMLGNPNSWAIRWFAYVQSQHGLGLFPRVSLMQNIGFDGSGVHAHNFGSVKPVLKLPDMPKQKAVHYAMEDRQKQALNPDQKLPLVQRIRRKIGV